MHAAAEINSRRAGRAASAERLLIMRASLPAFGVAGPGNRLTASGRPWSRKDAPESPGGDGQEGLEALDGEASERGVGPVELELEGAVRRLRELEARGNDDLTAPVHTVRGTEGD